MHESDQREWFRERLSAWRSTGNPEVLGQLIKWQRDRAYATALRILGNHEDAEDAVQQACIKLMSRTHGFDTPEQFKVTVYRAVVQCALDMARANRVRTNLEKAMSPLERNHLPLPQLAAEQAEALRMVWQELNTMPEESRALVVLCYQEGLSVTDAAEVLAVPRETLRDRLSSAMADLRKKLSQRGVILSLLAIAGLIGHGSAEAAPASLCEALDHALPGPSCSEIPAARAPLTAPGDFAPGSTAPAGHSVSYLPMAAGVAAALFVGAGIWFSLNSGTAQSQPGKPVASVSTTGIASEAPRANSAEIASPKPTPAAPNPPDTQPATATAPTQAGARNKTIKAKKRDIAQALERVPAPVREAAQRAVPGVKLRQAELLDEGNGKFYEFKGDADGKSFEIDIAPDGKVISVKPDDDNDDDDDAAKAKPVPPPAPPKPDF